MSDKDPSSFSVDESVDPLKVIDDICNESAEAIQDTEMMECNEFLETPQEVMESAQCDSGLTQEDIALAQENIGLSQEEDDKLSQGGVGIPREDGSCEEDTGLRQENVESTHENEGLTQENIALSRNDVKVSEESDLPDKDKTSKHNLIESEDVEMIEEFKSVDSASKDDEFSSDGNVFQLFNLINLF